MELYLFMFAIIVNVATLLFIIHQGNRIQYLEARMKTTSLRIRKICNKIRGADGLTREERVIVRVPSTEEFVLENFKAEA